MAAKRVIIAGFEVDRWEKSFRVVGTHYVLHCPNATDGDLETFLTGMREVVLAEVRKNLGMKK